MIAPKPITKEQQLAILAQNQLWCRQQANKLMEQLHSISFEISLLDRRADKIGVEISELSRS